MISALSWLSSTTRIGGNFAFCMGRLTFATRVVRRAPRRAPSPAIVGQFIRHLPASKGVGDPDAVQGPAWPANGPPARLTEVHSHRQTQRRRDADVGRRRSTHEPASLVAPGEEHVRGGRVDRDSVIRAQRSPPPDGGAEGNLTRASGGIGRRALATYVSARPSKDGEPDRARRSASKRYREPSAVDAAGPGAGHMSGAETAAQLEPTGCRRP